MKTVRIQYRAKPIIREQLRLLAKNKQKTISEILTEIVEDYLKDEEPTIQFISNVIGRKQ